MLSRSHRTHKTHLLSSRAVWGCVLFCMFTLLEITPVTAQEKNLAHNFFQFLQEEMDFSEEELKSIKKDEVFTKRVKSPIKQEVAMVSVAQINVPEDFFMQHYGENKLAIIEMAKADAWGTLKSPPSIADVQALTLPYIELGELGKCKLGDCKLKAPAKLIEAFGQLDKAASTFKERADALFQQAVVEYVQRYLKDGNAGMIEYRDKKKPLQIAEEFNGLLKQSPYLNVYMPEFRKYLENPPNTQLSNVKSEMYWMVERFGGKAKRPTISINHIMFYQPKSGEMIVASKRICATHYYETALGLTVIAKDPESPESEFYLMHIHRSRIDVLREVPGALAGDLFKGARELLNAKMTMVKENMEKLYQAR